MKKIINIKIFISILLLTVSIFAQNGLVVEKYPNGVLKKEEIYLNGKLNGECKYYSPKGIIKEILNYKFGKKEGQNYFYYDSGILKEMITFLQ